MEENAKPAKGVADALKTWSNLGIRLAVACVVAGGLVAKVHFLDSQSTDMAARLRTMEIEAAKGKRFTLERWSIEKDKLYYEIRRLDKRHNNPKEGCPPGCPPKWWEKQVNACCAKFEQHRDSHHKQ